MNVNKSNLDIYSFLQDMFINSMTSDTIIICNTTCTLFCLTERKWIICSFEFIFELKEDYKMKSIGLLLDGLI